MFKIEGRLATREDLDGSTCEAVILAASYKEMVDLYYSQEGNDSSREDENCSYQMQEFNSRLILIIYILAFLI